MASRLSGEGEIATLILHITKVILHSSCKVRNRQAAVSTEIAEVDLLLMDFQNQFFTG